MEREISPGREDKLLELEERDQYVVDVGEPIGYKTVYGYCNTVRVIPIYPEIAPRKEEREPE